MATETTTDMPETVSREAHQRMTDERNELKTRNEQLANTLKDLSFVDKARKHFVEKGVDDPEWAADIALPTIRSADVEIDGIGTFLDAKFAKLYPTPGDDKPVDETDDGVPAPDAAEPPGFARPSPAAEGAPPGQKKYSYSDPEYQAHLAANDKAWFEKMDKQGLIEWRTAPQ